MNPKGAVSKGDLVTLVREETELSLVDSKKVVDSIFNNITKSLKKGKDVVLVGFGSFTVVRRNARMGRNPKTGEAIKIKASKSPKFRAGRSLKDAVN